VDPILVAVILIILVPLIVLWALAKSASLRGPAPRHTPNRPVETLVTEAIPEEHPEEDEDYQAGAESPPSAPPADSA